jgi:hypothetical protein
MYYARDVDTGRVAIFRNRHDRDVYCIGGYSIAISSKDARRIIADYVFPSVVKQYSGHVDVKRKDVYNMPINQLIGRYCCEWSVGHVGQF